MLSSTMVRQPGHSRKSLVIDRIRWERIYVKVKIHQKRREELHYEKNEYEFQERASTTLRLMYVLLMSRNIIHNSGSYQHKRFSTLHFPFYSLSKHHTLDIAISQ
jgi:hypothetical protein